MTCLKSVAFGFFCFVPARNVPKSAFCLAATVQKFAKFAVSQVAVDCRSRRWPPPAGSGGLGHAVDGGRPFRHCCGSCLNLLQVRCWQWISFFGLLLLLAALRKQIRTVAPGWEQTRIWLCRRRGLRQPSAVQTA